MSDRLTRAEQQRQTRDRVIEAADRLFVEHGFHDTSVDQVARAAGYTKGAVYSNFSSKEDLFFAVYDRRAERGIAEMRRVLAAGDGRGFDALALAAARRRGREDGWLAAFFEFWAHVVRHPDLRARFAEIHLRVQEPLVEAMERQAAEQGYELPDDPRKLTVGAYAMQLGLSLERLTLPELVDERLGVRMGRLLLDDLARGGAAQEGDGDGPHLPASATG